MGRQRALCGNNKTGEQLNCTGIDQRSRSHEYEGNDNNSFVPETLECVVGIDCAADGTLVLV